MKKNLIFKTPGVATFRTDVTDLGYVDPLACGVVGDVEESNDEKNIVEELSEAASLRLRMATMDAIVDDIIENDVPDAKSTEDLERVISPVVDKAIARYYLPASYRSRVNGVIANALRKRNAMTNMLHKIASYSADELVDIAVDQDAKDDVKDYTAKPKDDQPDKGDDAIVKKDKQPDDLDTVEIIEDTQNTVQVNDVIDNFAVKESLRFTATASMLNKMALKDATDTFALPAFKYMTKQLRHVLPDSFKQRYDLVK